MAKKPSPSSPTPPKKTPKTPAVHLAANAWCSRILEASDGAGGLMLTGYLPSTEEPIVLYLDPGLTHGYTIERDSILVAETLPATPPGLEGTRLWLRKDASVQPYPAPPSTGASDYLQGNLYAQHLAQQAQGAPAAAGGSPEAEAQAAGAAASRGLPTLTGSTCVTCTHLPNVCHTTTQLPICQLTHIHCPPQTFVGPCQTHIPICLHTVSPAICFHTSTPGVCPTHVFICQKTAVLCPVETIPQHFGEAQAASATASRGLQTITGSTCVTCTHLPNVCHTTTQLPICQLTHIHCPPPTLVHCPLTSVASCHTHLPNCLHTVSPALCPTQVFLCQKTAACPVETFPQHLGEAQVARGPAPTLIACNATLLPACQTTLIGIHCPLPTTVGSHCQQTTISHHCPPPVIPTVIGLHCPPVTTIGAHCQPVTTIGAHCPLHTTVQHTCFCTLPQAVCQGIPGGTGPF